MKRTTVRLSGDLLTKLNEFAREAEVTQSAAIRMLVGRSLGVPLSRLLVDEKINQTNAMLQKRLGEILDALKRELHGAVEEVAPTRGPAVAPEEVVPYEDDESEDEPEAAPLEGRRRAKAKTRRKGRR